MDYLEQKTVLMSLKKFLICSFSIILIVGCSQNQENLPYYNTADFTPIFLSTLQSFEKVVPHKIEDFILTNEKGELFGSENLKGKIHVANFIFTSCTNICPKMTTNMGVIEEEFKKIHNFKRKYP